MALYCIENDFQLNMWMYETFYNFTYIVHRTGTHTHPGYLVTSMKFLSLKKAIIKNGCAFKLVLRIPAIHGAKTAKNAELSAEK